MVVLIRLVPPYLRHVRHVMGVVLRWNGSAACCDHHLTMYNPSRLQASQDVEQGALP